MNRPKNIEKIVFPLLILMLWVKITDCRALELPVPESYRKEIQKLEARHQSAEKELREIQDRILRHTPQIGHETRLQENIYKKDMQRLFELLEILERIKNEMNKALKLMDNLFSSPPPLKLVRITGPTPGIKNLVVNLNPSFQEEIDYAPNSAGYTRRVRNHQGQITSSSGLVVTYAPLEIIPGEPFHFEVEARQAAHWDSPQKCTPNDRVVMGLDVHSAIGIDARSYSKADLRCEPGAVRMSLRMKPGSPRLVDHPVWMEQKWEFPYTLEVVTSGDLKSPAKAEAVAFRLMARKDAIDLGDRGMYQVDVDVYPVSGETFGGPTLTLHYRAQDESIAFLPPYQFPDDTSSLLIAVPNLKDKSKREAVEALNRIRLNADITIGDPPSGPELVGKVAKQSPAPGEKVKMYSKINLTLYSNYTDTVTIPNIINLSSKEARARINAARLHPEIEIGESAPSADKPGIVYRQDPAAGTKVNPGTTVKMTLYSNFVETVMVPDLNGFSYDQAKRRLEAAGLSISRRDAGRPNQQGLADIFQKQDPPAGTRVSKGQAVLVWFYGQYVPAVDLRQVPDVTGLSLAEARQALERAGFVPVPSLIGAAPAQGQSGRVAAQRPTSGATLPPGSTVQVEVWGDYVAAEVDRPAVPPVQERRQQRTVKVHDLTGSYNKGLVKVTKENGKYVGRSYQTYNQITTREGYHTGIILFEVGIQPDVEETLQGPLRAPPGQFVLVNPITAYPGRCLNVIDGRTTYLNCHVYVCSDLGEGRDFGKMQLREKYQGNVRGKYATGKFLHDSRAPNHAVIDQLQVP